MHGGCHGAGHHRGNPQHRWGAAAAGILTVLQGRNIQVLPAGSPSAAAGSQAANARRLNLMEAGSCARDQCTMRHAPCTFFAHTGTPSHTPLLQAFASATSQQTAPGCQCSPRLMWSSAASGEQPLSSPASLPSLLPCQPEQPQAQPQHVQARAFCCIRSAAGSSCPLWLAAVLLRHRAACSPC